MNFVVICTIRLNVFPIQVPPLRERREDVPALVTHFVKFFSRRMRKPIEHIRPEIMAALMSYSSPGNIRELQNLVERAVILANDGTLPNPLALSSAPTVAPGTSTTVGITTVTKEAQPARPMTLREIQRNLILQTLGATGWILGGPTGAAVRLGLKRTTLIQRMKKLGIQRRDRGIDSPKALPGRL